MDRAHMIRGRPLQTHSEPQSEVIAGATLATSLSAREPAVLRARLAASRYVYHTSLAYPVPFLTLYSRYM